MRRRPHQLLYDAVLAVGLLAAVVLTLGAPGSVFAHEGHAALPSTGAIVEGDQVLVSENARKGLGLETATVTLQDLSRLLRVRANVELPWNGQAMVTTLAPGRVQAILVKPGEAVQAGQELARIESLEVETLQLTMLQANEEAALAERLVEQRRRLVQSGAVAGKSLAEAETELRQKRVQLALAERKLTALGLSPETVQRVLSSGEPIATIAVTSPIDGVVMHSDVRVGQFVDTEHHLFNIVDRSTVLVVGEVLETDAWQVEPGQMVQVTLSSLPDGVLTAQIERERLALNAQKRALEVVARMDNEDARLRPGMSGRMQITVQQAKDAIVCPIAALVHAPGGTFVLLRRGEGKYQRRKVKIGLRTPEQAEVLQGLFPGDRVVVTGAKLLASMFHTDRANSGSSASERARRISPQVSIAKPSPAIPVAQAVVQLPTSRKMFASPVIAGRIAAIHVHPGQTVEAGQILAELDSQELRSLQLELLETQEKLDWISEVLQRVAPLARSGSYSSVQLWEHQLEQKTLQHAIQNVERKLSLVGLSPEAIERMRQTDLSQSDMDVGFATAPVRAPAAGRLAEFQVALGQVVHANDSLFEIQDLSTVWIEGYVFEQHAARVEVGQTADMHFPAYPALRLAGKVVRTAPTLLSSARVLPVWIEVENPDGKLREGMFAKVEIRAQSRGEVAVLPPPRK